MFSYHSSEGFDAETKDKANYKPQKAEDIIDLLVANVVDASNAIKQFNEDFSKLNSEMCSDQWSAEAQKIAEITETISDRLQKHGTDLLTDVHDNCLQVNKTNTKVASAVSGIHSKLNSNLDMLSSIGRR